MKKSGLGKVGVIIVTYNSQDYIRSCLKSVLSNNYHGFEIVVVDNLSKDNSLTIVDEFKKIKIIRNDKNLGFGAANNIGIKYLLKRGCEFVLLINPDTISSPTLITELVGAFQISDKIGSVGCIITYVNSQKKIWFAGGSFNKLFCFTRHKYMDEFLNRTKIKSGTVDFITGACMMIKTEVIKKVGFIPEEYFLYFEDVFFCQKIKSKGFDCFLLASPLISHQVSTSTGTAQTNKMTPLRAYFYARNPIIYIRKEVRGYLKITNLIGQFFMRLPFYTYKIIKERNVKSFYYYCKGMVDAALGEASNFFLNKS